MKIFGLLDCNNFYASCERVFTPSFNNRPIVVLSNNDGCVIARSQEAKDMGIAMGEPYFKVKHLVRDGLVVRSCNFPFYGDMSWRVMTSLSYFVPTIEIYSIDECFLEMDGFTHLDLRNYALTIRNTILQWTGIPVSIGIAPTKTLCKIANHMVKRNPASQGVETLLNRADLHYALATTPIGDVWGIGHRWAKKLRADGIHHAQDLARAPDHWIRQKLGVIGLRVAFELRGIACHPLEDTQPDKQSICVSRSFGTMLTDWTELSDALKTFAMRAAEKLRRNHLQACHVSLFIRTNMHRNDLAQYRASLTLALDYPSNDSRLILKTILSGLRRIYKKGYSYKQAGVYMLNLVPESQNNASLFASAQPNDDALMQAMDGLQRRFGEGCIAIGQCKKSRHWYATRKHSSPRYTTSWQELPKVR